MWVFTEGTEKVHIKQDLSCNKLRSFLFELIIISIVYIYNM